VRVGSSAFVETDVNVFALTSISFLEHIRARYPDLMDDGDLNPYKCFIVLGSIPVTGPSPDQLQECNMCPFDGLILPTTIPNVGLVPSRARNEFYVFIVVTQRTKAMASDSDSVLSHYSGVVRSRSQAFPTDPTSTQSHNKIYASTRHGYPDALQSPMRHYVRKATGNLPL
jgi:hypothetical protein